MDKDLREALTGLTVLNQELGILEFANVIIRRNYKTISGVRLFCGGVAGNDLTYATYVGKGMLTAAILGDKVVPCSRTIMRTIHELNHGDINYGIFIICQNNAELFNFKLAADLAGNDCALRLKVLTVGGEQIIGKNLDKRFDGELLLMVKILGAMAEKGVFYNDIFVFYNTIQGSFMTVALISVDKHLQLTPEAEQEILKKFAAENPSDSSSNKSNNEQTSAPMPFVVLVNTPKMMTQLENFALAKRITERLNELGQKVVRMYLTSIGNSDMKSGALLTVIQLKEPKILEYLDAPCSSLGWQQITQYMPQIVTTNEIPSGLKKIGTKEIPLKGPELETKPTRVLTTIMQFILESLDSLETTLNEMDKIRSHGNVGSRFKLACDNVKTRLKNNKFTTNCPYALFKKLSIIVPDLLGGVMGSVYGVIFESAADVFGELPKDRPITQETWLQVLEVIASNVDNLCSSNMEPKTLCHPLRIFENVTSNALSMDVDVLAALDMGVVAAEDSVESTMDEEQQGPDAGAYAIAVMLRALYDGFELVVNNEKIKLE